MAIEHYADTSPLETQMAVVEPANPVPYDADAYKSKEELEGSTSSASPMQVVEPYSVGHEPESAPENLMAKEDSKMQEAPAPKAAPKAEHKEAKSEHKGFFSKK